MTTMPSETLHDFGNRVATRRYALGLAQEDLAVLVGRARSSIANIEAGRQNPPLTLVVGIAHVLRTTVGALTGESP